MILILPQELVDYIVDFLWNDFLPFYNCALVSHAWLPCARCYLSPRLDLRNRSQYDSLKQDILHDPQMWSYLTLLQQLDIWEDRRAPYVHIVPHIFARRLPRVMELAFCDVDWSDRIRPHSSFFRLVARHTP
ncbi:hypothetical protein AcV7_002691 [Taiwanofungus camphoratus]|nr:hypothetical protein AcV7_002691 [Antrodia cinnamomea]